MKFYNLGHKTFETDFKLWHKILIIRELKQTDVAAVNRQISIQFRVMDVKGRLNSFGLESF